MRCAVIGGKLQGVEAVYLAKKAGWETVLVDKNPEALAAGLCDQFCLMDISNKDTLIEILREVQFVIPAIEDEQALQNINYCSMQAGVPVVYDREAYRISSSKLVSDRLFADIGVPAPKTWPECGFPVVIKPSDASGSEGVKKIYHPRELEQFMKTRENKKNWVIQEYLEGPSYSLEVLCFNRDFRILQATELEMDGVHDCKRVLAPALLSDNLLKQFRDICGKIAVALDMNGIFDVEVILNRNEMKVLEIDARLPSQTPTAVYKSTGINVLEVLWEAYSQGRFSKSFDITEEKGIIYEHIKVSPGKLEVCGEHIMSDARHLRLFENFFGADEAITNYSIGKDEWAATLIITAPSRKEAWNRRWGVIDNIIKHCGIEVYKDETP